MTYNEKMSELIDAMCQRIDFTTTDDSLRKILRQIYPKPGGEEYVCVGWTTAFLKESLGRLSREDDRVGWTIALLKDYLPNIEIYVDELAKCVALNMRKTGKEISEDDFIRLMMQALNETFIHELIHEVGFIINEIEVEDYCRVLLEAMKMTWHYIPCPNVNELVDWKTCLECDDSTKHETCPLNRIRRDAVPREYISKRYHVSELLKSRYSFFERRYKTIAGWDDYWPMFWGRAIGWYVANLYGKESQEFELNVGAPALAAFYGVSAEPTDDFVITGHIDILSEADGMVLELKTQYNLKYITKGPNPYHAMQLQAYYTLGLVQFPDVFGKIKQLRIIYFGRNWRGSGMPPYKEHTVSKETVDLLTPARWLRSAEDTERPPPIHCPDWMCKNCPHKEMCRETDK